MLWLQVNGCSLPRANASAIEPPSLQMPVVSSLSIAWILALFFVGCFPLGILFAEPQARKSALFP